MNFLKKILLELDEYKRLSSYIDQRYLPIAVAGVSNVHKANIVSSLCANKKCKAFVVASDEAEAMKLLSDISAMGVRALFYPARDFNFLNIEGQSFEYMHNRLSVLTKIVNKDFDVVVFCQDSAAQYTIPKKILKSKSFNLKITEEISIEKLVNRFIDLGYERAEKVEGAGQFATRGGILDFFSPHDSYPIRVEFWGDEIDTISYFDVETQRRNENIKQARVIPAHEVIIDDREGLINQINNIKDSLKGKSLLKVKSNLNSEIEKLENNVHLESKDKFMSLIYKGSETLLDYIENEDIVFMSEPLKVKERMTSTLWQWNEDLKSYLENGVLCRGLDKYALDWTDTLNVLGNKKLIYLDTFIHQSYPVSIKDTINFTAKQLSVWGGSVKILCEDLESFNIESSYCVVLAGTNKAAKTVASDLDLEGFSTEYRDKLDELIPGKIFVIPGGISSGIEYPSINFKLITHGHLAKTSERKRKNKTNAKSIYSLSELIPSDYVVHSTHGIGIFNGIKKITMNGIVKDYITISYAKGDVLYVPVTQLDLVSKYVGPSEDSRIKLNKLGGNDWLKTKAKVRSTVKDIAKELIKLYSERMKVKGHAFSPDTEWQKDFEGRFEYEETVDQLRCIDEIKYDMERVTPMERLLCGDVGFGKTEVALRAAFKCISDSKQCAMLVPTTILSWQHYQTISKRFEGFPVKVELLSRFRTPKQQKEIIKKLKRGEIDMVVGTHRLVQKDIEFRDLGLVIIDEEQRFGVAHKEYFKNMAKNVDVLTLSATPIPRTLNMAMSGIRDMSSIEEAPQDRHPIQTYVLEYDSAIIHDAIRKELRRGGQVYYLHNKVETIDLVAANLRDKIPEAKIGIGHGKMSEQELSDVWKKMIDQEINVLVCTTIIETGIDIPTANTLIIENADHMGLSQLHQLRGRVGRSSRRAYAYLTFKQSKILSEISQKRLSAIREFTEFGSGFKIAMRDLELRGAGNILGGEQHGYMADVGYDMYIKLLNQAVKEEKGEEVKEVEIECLVDIQIPAYIPENYIGSLGERIDIYRRIADIKTKDDSLDVMDELIDRFGDPPQSVKGLIEVAMIRSKASSLLIYEIKQNQDFILLFQNKIDFEFVSKLIDKFKNSVKVNAGGKPYISIKMDKNENLIKILNLILEI